MPRFQLATAFIFVALTSGLIALAVVQLQTKEELANIQQHPPATTQTNTPTNAVATDSADLSSTLASQAAAINDLSTRLTTLENEQSQTTNTTPKTTSSFQKQVIYLGSTSTTNREWTDSGLEVILDSADYPSNVFAVFEAGLSIIGGNAEARLINTTTGAIITASEVSHNSSTVTWKTSGSFKLHSGKNAYRVQVRSNSSETAQVAGARIVIDR